MSEIKGDFSGSSLKRRLGAPLITLMIIAASAPLTVVAAGAASAYSVTGSIAVPIGYIVLGIILAIFAVGFTAMSRHIGNAGAFYAYIAQGIGKPAGVGASIVALLSYNAMQIGLYGMIGFQTATFVQEKTGAAIPWWVWVLIYIAVVAFLGTNSIDLSARVLGVLVVLEFVIVTVFDIVAFANPAEGFSAEPISPATLFTPGIGAVLVFGIAAFMGFESAAIYNEEAKDPKRTVTRATFAAVIIIGLFYAISSWALSLAVGPGKITDGGIALEEAGPPLFFNFAAQHFGAIIVDFISLIFITSLFAALMSFHNAVARYFFSLGREGLLPKALGRARANGAPWIGSWTQTGLALIVVIVFAIAGAGSELGEQFPVITLFTWLTNTGALGLVLLMAVVSPAVIGFFRRNHSDAGAWTRIVAPAVSGLALFVVFILILINFNVLLGEAEATATTYLFPALVIVPGIAGVVWGYLLKERNPALYGRIGQGVSNGTESAPEPVARE